MTNCTIIIPTYNRPAYLRRILSYYDSFREGFKIIVADSSSDENKKLNKDIIASVSNVKIQYLDHYSAEINPHRKFADVVNYANTEYCVFCADDDFITPNGIKQSVNFLEKNRDFVVAQGRYIGFKLESDKTKKQQFHWEFSGSPISIEFSDPESRLEYHLSNYLITTFYGVHRSDDSKMIYQEVLKSEVDPFLFSELLASMLTLIHGKMKYLDVLYGARDEDSIRNTRWIDDSISPGYWPTLREAIETGVYNEEYAKFRDCLSTHLSQQSQLDMEESRKVVDNAMSAYMKKYFYPSRSKRDMGYITTKMGQALDNLHLPVPGWLNRGIRKPYKAFVAPRYVEKRFRDMPSFSTYYEDFNRIRRQVLSSSK